MQDATILSQDQKKMLFLSSLGGVLEFYDFIIYIFLAPYLEKVFFAGSSTYIATLKTLAIFSIGYLLRPMGGILFSHLGDRHGRKVVFLMTVVFMAIPAFAIGILPTPAQIGVAAPLLLLLFRMMQGLALGGEIPAAITFVSEHVGISKRAFALSTLFFGINIGLLLGSLVTTLMSSWLSLDAMLAYGWRIPFIIGGVFGILCLFLRRHLHETRAFLALKQENIQRFPMLTVLQGEFKQVLFGVSLVSIGSVTIFLYLYLPQYLAEYFHYDFSFLMIVNTFGTLVLNIFIIIGGLIADRYGFSKVYIIGTALVCLLTYPIFQLFGLQSMTGVVIAYVLLSILYSFIPGAYTSILSTLYQTPVRYSGIALSYNLSFAIFGGLSPVICTLLIHYLDNIYAPAIFVSLIALLACCVCAARSWRISASRSFSSCA